MKTATIVSGVLIILFVGIIAYSFLYKQEEALTLKNNEYIDIDPNEIKLVEDYAIDIGSIDANGFTIIGCTFEVIDPNNKIKGWERP